MKPLELHIYEKHQGVDGASGPVYRVGGSFTPYIIVATEKRFSDAELAAEHWSWQGNLQWWLRPESRVFPNYRRVVARVEHRAEVMERFATLPHFDA